ncbi:MAG: DVU_1551 family NTP transferase [Thermodesulfobacteriota bacterium]
MKVCALILAAGFSSRMHEFKPLLQLKGQSVVQRCVKSFHSAGISEIFAVTGHRHEETEAECLGLQVKPVYNPEYALGMFSSVQAGVKALPSDADAFFVMPADIFLVRPWSLYRLCQCFDAQSPLVAYPCFRGQRGHPPLISGHLRSAVLDADDPGGLRRVLEQFEHGAFNVPVFDRNILMDMDRPQDLQEMEKRLEKIRRLDSLEAWELVSRVEPISQNGLSHGLAVARAARALAFALNRAGCSLDPELAYTCGLVHDMAKGQPGHEKAGGELLRKMGLDDMAPAVASHRDVKPGREGGVGTTEVVFIADKMIRGEKRVEIKDRFQEKLDLYSRDPEAVAAISGRLENALEVEKAIRKIIGRPLDEVIDSPVSGSS